jgi:uncharacterized coiled-coil protein SlyX
MDNEKRIKELEEKIKTQKETMKQMLEEHLNKKQRKG